MTAGKGDGVCRGEPGCIEESETGAQGGVGGVRCASTAPVLVGGNRPGVQGERGSGKPLAVSSTSSRSLT